MFDRWSEVAGEARTSLRTGSLRGWVALIPMVAVWLWTWRHLSGEWRAYPQYGFGWGVPALGLLLMWRQWPGELRPIRHSAWCLMPVVLGILVLGLGEIARRHDPTWRGTGVLLMLACTGLTAAWILRVGGLVLLQRLAGVLVFFWTAVPWPVPFEAAVTQGLLRFVTSVVLVLTTALGIPAFQRGSAIELAGGWVGVDDACSGIQSLQSAIMVALFLGEFRGMSRGREAAMVILGPCAAILGNVLRVTALVLVTAYATPEKTEEYHDLIGGVATTLILLGVLGIAKVLAPAVREPLHERRFPGVSVSYLDGVTAGLIAAVGVGFFVLDSHAGSRRFRGAEEPAWALNVADLPPGWRVEQLEPRPREVSALRATTMTVLRIRDPRGRESTIYHLFWAAKDGVPPLGFQHTPALCMPGLGWEPAGAALNEYVSLGSASLPAVIYPFKRDTAFICAIQILSAGGMPQHYHAPGGRGSTWQRFTSAFSSPRVRIDEELLLYIPAASTHMALEDLRTILPLLLPHSSPR